VITARCSADPCGKRDGSITSARITTQKLFEQKYGRFEARIRLPEGAGLWPAFWMIGANVEEVSWPASGEIDIMENVGREPERVFATVHGPGYSAGNSISNELDLPEGETFADDFHIFAVEWDPARITFSVDGQVQDGVVVGGEVFNIVRSANVSYLGEWVFNNEFFVILNLAVGGTLGGSVDDTACITRRPPKIASRFRTSSSTAWEVL
jgi:beta-glucanase (GH16 family)